MPSLPSSLWGTNKNDDKTSSLKELLTDAHPSTSYLVAVVVAGSAFLVSRKFGKRIRNSEWINPNQLKGNRWIKGVVTSVGDADNFRLYHTPPLGYNWPFRFRRVPTLAKDLKDETIHIRLAGVDAPEGTYFGKPGQLYHAEALAWLQKQISSRKVYCQVLRRDQYKRIIAHVYLPPRLLPGFLISGRNVAAEMLKAGWAVTYEQAGAEYGPAGKEGYLRLENQAKAAKRGMWKGGETLETPAEYKRRIAGGNLEAGQTRPQPGPARSRSSKRSRPSWLRSWFR